MAKRWQRIRDGLIVTAMVGLSFGAGWWTCGHEFANSRRITFDFSKRFTIPPGYEPIVTTPTPDTATFLVGDRIDILIQDGDSVEPLILDAVVIRQTKTNFGMLSPYGGRDLLDHAMDNGLQLIFRPSIAATDPIAFEPNHG